MTKTKVTGGGADSALATNLENGAAANDQDPPEVREAKKRGVFRRERDLMGEADMPADAYWGVHSLRALENFPISGVKVGDFPELVRALALVKQAAARANCTLGDLEADKAGAIERACERVIADAGFADQFAVDMIQGGAGTSTNMMANEIITNIALEAGGHAKGSYHLLHPNDDVNMAQSTNDVYPTALRLSLIFATEPLLAALEELGDAFARKSAEFADVLKVGRTQLQDAVPMTVGQEFNAYCTAIRDDVIRLREAAALFCQINLGATAIGTGITTDARYAPLVTEELSRVSGLRLALAPDLIAATSDMGDFVQFSGVLKRVAVKLSKLSNDLRLLSSGPRAGLGEIRLPVMQAGSSIMPGKVNPVIPEVVNQVAFMVMGHDLTVTLCAEGGQLQLNAFEPTIGYCLLTSLRQLTAAVTVLRTRCVEGIEVDRERCLALVEDSISLVTALAPVLGYETSSRVAKRALSEQRRVSEIILEEKLLAPDALAELFRIENMTAPSQAPLRAGRARS
ncbi:aspartate ammonia-lyase [Pelagibacterium lacus]|uniref:Aspartate ammonia-lyase n=1 Tax=Pelagibacterium lacus TaxID=2282655 RepID=A0A369W7T8_9HYPH|nr:aspartate ammonia-lyase [Pelagibacterium lacus]RDE10087.1 aspartate ammonia-lyase [Pelagibacterium lacus]